MDLRVEQPLQEVVADDLAEHIGGNSPGAIEKPLVLVDTRRGQIEFSAFGKFFPNSVVKEMKEGRKLRKD